MPLSRKIFEGVLEKYHKLDIEITDSLKKVSIISDLYKKKKNHFQKDLFSAIACCEIKEISICGAFTFDDDLFENLTSLEKVHFGYGRHKNTNVITHNVFKNLHNLKIISFGGITTWIECLRVGCFDNLNLDQISFEHAHFNRDIECGIFDTIGDTKLSFKYSTIYSLKNCTNVSLKTCTIKKYPRTEKESQKYNRQQSLEKMKKVILENLPMSIIDCYWYENKPSLGYSRLCDFSVKN